MGVGPAVAIPTAVKAAGLELDDINLFEINEVKDNITTLLSIHFAPTQTVFLVVFISLV